MATSEQIKALLKSHFQNEEERFVSIALQIAAHESRLGHSAAASDIKQLVDRSRNRVVQLRPVNSELQGLVLEMEPRDRLANLIVKDDLQEHIETILLEYREREKLHRHGLKNRRKVLLYGPPGTGKTMTAEVIAHELKLPLYVIEMHRLMMKFMGESALKLRMVFDMIRDKPGVYLFDEFDAIGADRERDNDVGEMRRVLNSFLQWLERDNSESIIIAATNTRQILDRALFRRFDDVLEYSEPTPIQIEAILMNNLGTFQGSLVIKTLSKLCVGLSPADIVQVCIDSKKAAVLKGESIITKPNLTKAINKRKKASSTKN